MTDEVRPDTASPPPGPGGRPGVPAGRGREVFAVALRLGLTSFGGPIAHIGYFRREYVDRRRWLDEATFADLVTLCQLLPGPASSQLGVMIGSRRAGPLGGLLAWAGFTLPSAIAMILFGLYAASVDLSGAGWIHGLKLAAVVIVAQAVGLMARALTPDRPRLAIAAAAAAVALAWPTAVTQIAIIGVAAIAGHRFLVGPTAAVASPPRGAQWSARAGLACLGVFVALLVGLPIARAVVGEPLALVDAFYRAGSLVFGGGHVIVPLLQASVVEPGLVSSGDFLAGYGAVQAMPGPLFTVAGYLGTVSTVPPNGLAGAIAALAAIFLPSFLLVFGALPFWDRIRAASGMRRALAGTNAAVVGILLAALISPIVASAVTSPRDLLLVGLGLAMLVLRNAPPIVVVVGLAMASQALAG